MLGEDAKMQQRWKKATKTCAVSDLTYDKLKSLVYSGMPMKYRTELWTQWALQKSIPASMENLQTLASDVAIRDIVKDVPRTQPAWFEDTQLSCLQRVLEAYAGWNPDIGYCQGMNFMAAVFVSLGFSDAESFIGLSYLVEEMCPEFHNAELSGFHRDAAVLDKLVQHFLPSVHEELAEIGIPISLLAMDHLISLGSRNWPLASTVRLWDVIFMEGSRAIFASFLALLELYIPVGRHGGILNRAARDDMSVASDVMDSFKRESSRGVSNHMDAVMKRVQRYVRMIPEAWVVDLRESVNDV
jgi:hypothetical protein